MGDFQSLRRFDLRARIPMLPKPVMVSRAQEGFKMKRIAFVIALVAWLAAYQGIGVGSPNVSEIAQANNAMAPSNQGLAILFGDSNQHGVFDQADLDLLVSWIFGPPPPAPEPGSCAFIASDVGGNSLLDIPDANLFQLHLNGSITEFPVEQNGNEVTCGNGSPSALTPDRIRP